MKNLAGDLNCDDVIHRELVEAGVDLVVSERSTDEVPATISGRLGDFTFTRAWYYWRVHGPMPVAVAERLNITHERTIRICGFAGGVNNVSEYVVWRGPDGAQIWPDPDGSAEAEWNDFVKRHPRFADTANDKNIFAADPSKVPGAVALIESYHVDTQDGLNVLAKEIRDLKGASS